jgi:hypothetical protein
VTHAAFYTPFGTVHTLYQRHEGRVFEQRFVMSELELVQARFPRKFLAMRLWSARWQLRKAIKEAA